MVNSEDIALDYAGLSSLCDVIDARWQNGVSVIGQAIFGKEADQALRIRNGEVSPRLEASRMHLTDILKAHRKGFYFPDGTYREARSHG